MSIGVGGASFRRASTRWSLFTLAYAALAVIFTWPLALRRGDAVASSIDSVDSTWRIGHAQKRLLTAPWRLFEAELFHPYPSAYLFDELIVGAALLTLPLRLFTDNPVAIYNVALLATLVLNALAGCALARHLRCGPVAAFAAGLIYAYAPIRFGHIDHIGLLSAQYFPLIILLLDRLWVAPRRRDVVLLAALLAIQALSSQYYALYLPLVCGGFIAVRLAHGLARRAFPSLRTWMALAASGVLAALVVLPFALGYLMVQQQHDFARSVGSNLRFSANLASFVTAGEGNLLWGPVTAPLRALGSHSVERDLLIGAVAFLLALLGAIVTIRRPLTHYLLALGGGAAILALGPILQATDDPGSRLFGPLPYHYLYHHLPLFDSMRVPARLAILYALAVAVLAGLGLHWLLGRAARVRRGPALRIGLIVTILGALCLESANRPRTLVALERGTTIPPVYRWLAAQPAMVAIELPLHTKRDLQNNRMQYFSLYHDHSLVNGSADIVPNGYRSLAEELYRGLTPRALAILQGLGVTHIVVHDWQLPPSAAEQTRSLLDSDPALTPKLAEFGDSAVYQLASTDRYSRLRSIIPPDATIYLAQDAAQETYLGMLGWVLRDNRLYARVPTTFGQRIAGPPQPAAAHDYAVLHRRTDPTSIGLAGATLIWESEVARVYRRAGR